MRPALAAVAMAVALALVASVCVRAGPEPEVFRGMVDGLAALPSAVPGSNGRRFTHAFTRADEHGVTALEYDVTLAPGVLALDRFASELIAVECTADELRVVPRGERARALVAGWTPGSTVVAGEHWGCGLFVARLVSLAATAEAPRVGGGRGGVDGGASLAPLVWSIDTRLSAANMTGCFEHARIAFTYTPHLGALESEPEVGPFAGSYERVRPRLLYEKSVDAFNFNYDKIRKIAKEWDIRSGWMRCVNCYAFLSAGVTFELDISNFWIDTLVAKVSGEAGLSGDVIVENPSDTRSVNEERAFDIGSESVGYEFKFVIVGVPITIQPRYRLQGLAKAAGSAELRMTAGLTAKASAEFGVSYAGGSWSAIATPSWSFDYREPQYYFEVKDVALKAYVMPQVSLTLWQSLTVGVSAKPYVAFTLSSATVGEVFPPSPAASGAAPAADAAPLALADLPISLDALPDFGPFRPERMGFGPDQTTATASSVTLSFVAPPARLLADQPLAYQVDYFECAYWPLPCGLTTSPWVTATASARAGAPYVMGGLDSGEGYGVRARASGTHGLGDYSPSVTVSTLSSASAAGLFPYRPRARETIQTGMTVTLRWGSTGLAAGETLRVDLMRDTTGTDTLVMRLATAVLAATGEFNWTVPYAIPLGSNLYVLLVANSGAVEAAGPQFTTSYLSNAANGRFVVAVDRAYTGTSTSDDPYVTLALSFGASSPLNALYALQQSSTRSGNNPVFGQEFQFGPELALADARDATVTLSVYDDGFLTDELRGSTSASCATFSATSQTCVFTARPLSGGTASGTPTITFTLRWQPLGASATVANARQAAVDARAAARIRATPACPLASADGYQLSYGLGVSARIGDVTVPTSIPIVGGMTVFPGGELGGAPVMPAAPFTCGVACGGCVSALKADTRHWVLPEQQRVPSRDAALAARRKEILAIVLGVVLGALALCCLVGLCCWWCRRRSAAKDAERERRQAERAEAERARRERKQSERKSFFFC